MFTLLGRRAGLFLLLAGATATAQPAPLPLPVTSGLVLHLETDQGLVSNNAQVNRWNDQSPRGNDLFGTGGVTLLPAATPSGAAAIGFGGTDGVLQRIHGTHPLQGFPTGISDRTVIVLARYHAAPVSAGFTYGTANANWLFGVGVRAGSGVLQVQTHTAVNNNVSSPAAGVNAGWLIQTAVHAAGFTTLFKDGVSVAHEKKNLGTSLTRAVLGQDLVQSRGLPCDVAAVLLYDRALTATERASVEAYLVKKYLTPPENTAPVVTILQPPEGATSIVGEPVTLLAQVADAEDDDLAPQINWASDVSGALGTGASLTTTALAVGTHVITAAVIDSGGLTDVDSITLHVQAAAPRPPTATLNSAPASIVFGGDWSHALSGSDPDGDLVRLELELRAPGSDTWTGVQDWAFAPTASFAMAVSAPPTLAGTWSARVRATDTGERFAFSSSTTVLVGPATPIGEWADWTRRAESSGMYEVTTADLGARFVHPFSTSVAAPAGAVEYHYASFEGGTWLPLAAGQALAPAEYRIRAAYTGDANYAAAEVEVRLTVLPALATAPVVTIVAPDEGVEIEEGVATTFTATVTDEQEDGGALAATLVWSSDLDGPIGQGASITTTLSAGLHFITARVTDASGLDGSDEIAVRVRPAEGLVLGGLVLRLEAGAGVLATAGVVESWADFSGAGNDLQAVETPELLAAVTPAGGPAIRFDGGGDRLERSSAQGTNGLPVLSSDRTLFVVGRFHASSGAAGVSYGHPEPGGEFGLVVEPASGQMLVQSSPNGDGSLPGATVVGLGWGIHAARVSGGEVELYLENEQISSGVGHFETGAGAIVLGASLDGSSFAAMDVVAVLLYDRALSSAELERVHAYLERQLRTFADEDGDGLPDAWETEHFGGLEARPDDDSDGDGVANEQEYGLGLDPRRVDSDTDGMPDGWELLYQMNPYVDDAEADDDGDGVSNRDEFRLGRSPKAGATPDHEDLLRLRVFQPAN